MASFSPCVSYTFGIWCTSVHPFMTSSHLIVGKKGELVSARYLRSLGYVILDRNVKTYRGEIDLIAQKDDLILFVEVKAKKKADGFSPSIRVDGAKRKRLLGAANAWLDGRDDVYARIDVIGVCEGTVVEHFEDVMG